MAEQPNNIWDKAISDITESRQVVDDAEVSDVSELLNTITLFDRDNNEQQNLNDKNIILRVFCTDPKHNNSEIKEDEIVFISSTPEMPHIDVQVEIADTFEAIKYGDTLNATLEVVFSIDQGTGDYRKYRKDVQRYPVNQAFIINLNKESIFTQYYKSLGKTIYKGNILPRYSEIFRGGEAILKIFNDKGLLLKTFNFQIRGLNPSRDEVKTYLVQSGFLEKYWFVAKILVAESGSDGLNFVQQFNDPEGAPKLKIGVDYRSKLGGTPVWGYPDGWAVGQIDHDGVEHPEEYLDPNFLWNWKMNIAMSMNDVAEKVAVANQIIKKHIINFKKKYGNKIFKAPAVLQENITYLQAPSEIFGVTVNEYFQSANSIMDNQKSIIDAQIIKEYNGGSFLIGIELDEDGNGRWKWSDKSVNKKGEVTYYVKKISKMNDL